MDLKNLLGKLDVIEGTMKSAERNPTGPKFTGKWKGTDKGLPGKKLVGDSVEPQENILKDLSKGVTPKTKEQELSEEYQAFLEAEFKDTVDKRPGRASDRPSREYGKTGEQSKRYKTIKTEASADRVYTVDITRRDRTRSTSGTIPELLEYFGYTLEVGKSYERERGRYKINMNPRNIQQLVDALNKAASNGAANGAASTYYSVGQSQVAEGVPYKATNKYPALQDPVVAKVVKQMRPGLGLVGLDMANEAFLYYAYELGKDRARADWETYYPAIRQAYMMDKSKHAKDLDEASDRERAEHRKQALAQWKEDHFGSSEGFEEHYGNDLDWQDIAQKRWDDDTQDIYEGWESGPEEYEEPYDDADDAYERQRQEKIDTEAEKEWAKLPKVSTYKLLGRGPNMEPNYEFGGTEYDTLEQAIEARAQLMADPKTPHPEHIGIQTLTRVKDQTDEAVDSNMVQPMGQDTFNRAGFNPLRDERDYLDRLSGLSNLYRKPGLDPAMKAEIFQRINDLNKAARAKGYIQAESRGHKIVATKLKDIERSKNFRVPSAEERRELAQRMKDFEAQLAAAKSKKKQVKEYGATNNVSPYGQPTDTPTVDPAQAAQGAQLFKAATGSTAPAPNIAKAIDTLAQGKLPTQQQVKDMQPAMKDVATIAQDPKLASGSAKTAFQQANQAQLKQQQQAKK